MAAEIQVFSTGFIMMCICIGLGILMALAGGTVIDLLTLGDVGEQLTNSSHVSTEFKDAQQDTMWFFINLYYFICYCLPVLGIVIFIQSILPKTTGDKYA